MLTTKTLDHIAHKLCQWYNQNARKLPWREVNDPYKIWLSEIILQQTRVEQGKAYYYRFIESFPTVKDLAQASEDNVLRLWQGLGYYSRARNLHKAAKLILTQYNGFFPSDYSAIRSLPGVGDYTAGAIASFAFGLSYPAVDGNVLRVLSRIEADITPIDSTIGKKRFTLLASKLVKLANPSLINQALMELGATICTPRSPQCSGCPIQQYCKVAGLPQAINFPYKKQKTKVVDRFLFYIYIIDDKGYTLLAKRKGKDIWNGLYQLPLIDSFSPLNSEQISKQIEKLWGRETLIGLLTTIKTTTHILSHQKLHLTFMASHVTDCSTITNNTGIKYFPIHHQQLENFALPAAIFKHLPQFIASLKTP